jgi:hypothetical protein
LSVSTRNFLEEPEFCVFYAGFFPIFMR